MSTLDQIFPLVFLVCLAGVIIGWLGTCLPGTGHLARKVKRASWNVIGLFGPPMALTLIGLFLLSFVTFVTKIFAALPPILALAALVIIGVAVVFLVRVLFMLVQLYFSDHVFDVETGTRVCGLGDDRLGRSLYLTDEGRWFIAKKRNKPLTRWQRFWGGGTTPDEKLVHVTKTEALKIIRENSPELISDDG